MSQSLGNYVGITEPPDEMFGKLMRIPDELIGKYLRLVAWLPSDEVARVEAGLADGSAKPNDQKRAMARAVVDLYHGPGRGRARRRGSTGSTGTGSSPRWSRTSGSRTEPPRTASSGCPRLLVALDLASSNGDARRRIEQGGVRLDDEPVTDPSYEARREDLVGKVLQVGRRWFGRLA